MIKTETRERIATIELARLDKKNALTAAMYAAMTDTLAAAESDSGVRAIVIHGTRDCFTAGNDLKDFLEGPAGASQALRFVSALSKVCKPVVAAVGGPAATGPRYHDRGAGTGPGGLRRHRPGHVRRARRGVGRLGAGRR